MDVEKKIGVKPGVSHFFAPGKWGTAGLAPIFFAFACAALAGSAPLPQSAAESLPDSPGKETFVSVCSLCHSPTAPMGKQWTRQQWELKVTEMLQEEPDVTREERATIVEYLAANFKPGGKIYINKADAKDLEAALEISAVDADTIVRYRKAQGDFKTFEDVNKVPNINISTIEIKKDRLQF